MGAEEMISANLRRLREQRRMTQEALARSAGLSRLAYRNIETRKSVPRADTLQSLATALGVGIEALVSPVPHLRHVRFRSQKRLNSREQVLASVAERLVDFNQLEEMLGERERRQVPMAVKAKPGPSRSIAAAKAARTAFGLDEREPVRDICGLLESRGYKVILVDIASDGFFGLSVAEEDGGPAIVVNRWARISVERRIFTAAHELGHLLLHHGAYDVSKSAEAEDEEKEANVFASHFLMPHGVFTSEWEETCGLPFLTRVFKVKRMFRVSYRTVLYRLRDLHSGVNYFAKANAEYVRAFGKPLGRADEPHGLDEREFHAPEPLRAGEPEELLPSDFEEDRLSRLVRQAVERGLITLSRGAEILGKSLEEMRDLSSSWVR